MPMTAAGTAIPPPADRGDRTGSRDVLRTSIAQARRRRWLIVAAGVALLLTAALASVSLGVESLGLRRTIAGLLAPWLPGAWTAGVTPTQIAILRNLRLPRTLMAAIGGAGLAVAGVAMQG